MKKSVNIIIIVILILAAAGLFIKGFGREGKLGLSSKEIISEFGGGERLIDELAKQTGEKVPSIKEAIDSCEKSAEDINDLNLCYTIIAVLYRDESVCQYIEDAELRQSCNSQAIEKAYSQTEGSEGGWAELSALYGSLISGGGLILGEEEATPTPVEESITKGEENTEEESITEGEENTEREENTEEDIEEEPIISKKGKMTDEIYADILAHTSIYARDLSTYADKMNALYKKYGVTQEEMSAYDEELQKDEKRAEEVSMKYIQRLMELGGFGAGMGL
ncbi:MAG: hypothetical protein BWY03_00051 [Parcubacteria group bacterium ADurb.Bin159]|jgi:hypothetical protein|nr:MAG: hypothetical protein BWY03_00051 [Parcubacteria group bacterium ADurb.Bin159]